MIPEPVEKLNYNFFIANSSTNGLIKNIKILIIVKKPLTLFYIINKSKKKNFILFFKYILLTNILRLTFKRNQRLKLLILILKRKSFQ